MIQTRINVFAALLKLVLLTASLLVCSGAASADENSDSVPITVKAFVSPVDLTVGDLATYSIIVIHDEATEITSPPLKDDFTGFELIDQGSQPAKKTEGKIEQEFWYRLRADKVGSYKFSGPVIQYEKRNVDSNQAAVTGEIQAPDATATIHSILYKDGEPRDIRAIKPIVGAGWPWKKYLWPALAFISLACLIGFAASWWVKRNQIRPVIPVTPPLPPDEMALRELEKLFEKGYHEKNRFRELYFELSEIFRRYLGDRFQIPALDWTTEEIRHTLSHHAELSMEQRDNAVQVLTNSDLVKFAKFQVDRDTAIRLMKSARIFIQETGKPAKAPQEADQNAVSTF